MKAVFKNKNLLVIPAINCLNWSCVFQKLKAIKKIKSEWVQFDISDGKFAKPKTWGNKISDLEKFKKYRQKTKIEVHLMVENPLLIIDNWLKAGVKRIIVHLEALTDKKSLPRCRGAQGRAGGRMHPNLKINQKVFSLILKKCKAYNVELGLAINPKTPVEKLIPYLKDLKFIQILTVEPGRSGQKFQPKVLKKIQFLRKKFPNIVIEVDGGINLKTAKLAKKAGTDILVSASYLWKSSNLKNTLEKLSQV